MGSSLVHRVSSKTAVTVTQISPIYPVRKKKERKMKKKKRMVAVVTEGVRESKQVSSVTLWFLPQVPVLTSCLGAPLLLIYER